MLSLCAKLFIHMNEYDYSLKMVANSVCLCVWVFFFKFTLTVVTWVILKINYNQGVSLLKPTHTLHVVNHCKYILTLPFRRHYHTLLVHIYWQERANVMCRRLLVSSFFFLRLQIQSACKCIGWSKNNKMRKNMTK